MGESLGKAVPSSSAELRSIFHHSDTKHIALFGKGQFRAKLADASAATQVINLSFLAREFQHPRSSLPFWFSLLLRCGLLLCPWRRGTCGPLPFLGVASQLCPGAMRPTFSHSSPIPNTAARQVTAEALLTTCLVPLGFHEGDGRYCATAVTGGTTKHSGVDALKGLIFRARELALHCLTGSHVASV